MCQTTAVKDPVVGLRGYISGSWWRKPAEVQRLEALSAVSDSMYVRTAYADHRWFYSCQVERSNIDWVCRVIGVSAPTANAAIYRSVETSTDRPRALSASDSVLSAVAPSPETEEPDPVNTEKTRQ